MSFVRQFVVVLAVIFNLNYAVGQSIKFHFPRSNGTTYPRLRLLDLLPPLREFTFCASLRRYGVPKHNATILSYATRQSQNEVLLMLCSDTHRILLQLERRGDVQYVTCEKEWEIGQWRQVCVSWFGPNGIARFYIDGEFCHELEAPSRTHEVPGGGVFMLGQDQDGVDAKFDPTQAWYGDMTGVHLWDEVLLHTQIKDIGRCGQMTSGGNIIKWAETGMAAYDGVIMAKTAHCSPF